MGFLLFKGDGGLITGSYEEHAPRQVAASKFAHGTQEVSAELSGAEPGKYTLVMCTFAPQQEKAFAFTLFATSSSVKVEPLNGGRIDTGAAGVTSKRVPPSAPTYKSDAAKVAPPKASSKQDSAAIRAADDDDGKMGYASGWSSRRHPSRDPISHPTFPTTGTRSAWSSRRRRRSRGGWRTCR